MVSARRVLVALVAGERDPDVFSEPAPGTLRGKSPMLNKAPACFFKVRVMLEAVDRTTARTQQLSAETGPRLSAYCLWCRVPHGTTYCSRGTPQPR
jgi:hypothetical protein